MGDTFISLSDALAKMKAESTPPKFRSERNSIFNEVYSYYENSYKKNTWSSYITWLKKNKFKHSKERVVEFKKDPTFRKQISVKSLCSFWLGFMKTQDLYYLASVMKDKENRGENVNKWLFWAIKTK